MTGRGSSYPRAGCKRAVSPSARSHPAIRHRYGEIMEHTSDQITPNAPVDYSNVAFEDLPPEEVNRRRREIWRLRSKMRFNRGPRPAVRPEYTFNPEWLLSPAERVSLNLERIVALLASTQHVNRTPSTEPKPALPVNKNTKGKNINANMLTVLSGNKLAAGWSSAHWAGHLGCSESTIRGTKTWRELLKSARALAAAERKTRGNARVD